MQDILDFYVVDLRKQLRYFKYAQNENVIELIEKIKILNHYQKD